jgi:putative salt-induced outer membrane protein YdiY
VTRLTIQDPILVVVATGPPTPVTIVAAADGQATLQPGGLVALADIASLARPQPPIIVDGGANAGIITTAGNTDVNNLRLDGDIVARADVNRYSASAAVTRANDRGVETARNWTTAFKYDRFVSTRMFLNANAIFTNDRFRDLDLRTAVGAGVGYQVLTGPLVTLTADGGVGYVNENLESQPDDSYTALRESASFTAFAIPDRIQFFHVHDGYFGATGEDNLFVRMQNGVRLALAAGFVTTLRHDLDYDKSPAVGRSNTDRTLALTLGYRF